MLGIIASKMMASVDGTGWDSRWVGQRPSRSGVTEIQFLAFFSCLCLLIDDPVTSPPLTLTKMLSLGAIEMISIQRKPVKAITDSFSPPTSCHFEA